MPSTRSKNKRSIVSGKNLHKTPLKKQSLPCTVDITPSSDCTMLTRHHAIVSAVRRLDELQSNIAEENKENMDFDSNEQRIETDSDSSYLVDSSDEDEESRMKRLLKERNKVKETKQQILKKLGIVESTKQIQDSISKQKAMEKMKRASQRQFKTESNLLYFIYCCYRSLMSCLEKEPLIRRQSLRLLRKDPKGVDLPPEPVIPEEVELRKPGTQFPMVAVGFEKSDLEMDELDVGEVKELEKSVADYHDFMKNISSMKEIPDFICEPSQESDLENQKSALKCMIINPDNVQKVVKGRIFSIAIHPSNTEVLVAAGDKYGNLGLWNVIRKDSNYGTYMFSPHIRPISCIRFSTANSNKLYTCSYDGQLRCMDLQKNVFEEAIIDDDSFQMSGFDFIDSNQTLVMGCSNGSASIIDTRISPKDNQVRTFEAHNRATKCVSCHPLQKHYIATSHRDSSVFIFDIRKLTATNKCKPVICLNQHNKSVSSAYFSPLSGKHLLTTSYDNRLRIYHTSTISQEQVKLKSSCYHNNQTGRWLSSFRSAWRPNTDSVFVVGSMNQPRQIEVFNSDASLVHTFCNPEVLGSICSLNCFHDTRNILAGGNSSGKVYLFSDEI